MFAAVAAALLVAAGCGGSKKSVDVVTGAGAGSGGVVRGVPTPDAAGITVVGRAEAKARPDGARVALAIGSGEGFGSSGQGFELVDEKELEPVVAALVKAGAPRDDIVVDAFASGPYERAGAQVEFKWPRADGVRKPIEAAQVAARKQTDYSLQNANIQFTIHDCAPVEEKAFAAALRDARGRAERLAKLAGLKLGDVRALAEVTGSSSPYDFASPSGCAAFENVNFSSSALIATFGTPNGRPDQVSVSVALQVTFDVAEP
jgi:hypothetical protein